MKESLNRILKMRRMRKRTKVRSSNDDDGNNNGDDDDDRRQWSKTALIKWAILVAGRLLL